MSEHWIRLRGGWEFQEGLVPADPGTDPSNSGPLTLPIAWPESQVGPVRLIRRFGCPPIKPGLEIVTIRLDKVPGLLAVQLNGRAWEGPLDESLTLTQALMGPLLAKNLLILDLDPARARRSEDTWGQIALVIEQVPGG